MVKSFKKFSFRDRLTRLDLTSLADMRMRGKEWVHMNDFFNLCQTGYNLRGHNKQPSEGSTQFLQRVVRPWNQLPKLSLKHLLSTHSKGDMIR